MNLYLVQHGKARAKDEDAERPLTLQGRAEIERIAEFTARHSTMNLTSIYHSGKLRAQQTADIFGEHLTPDSVESTAGLKPNDDPAKWAEQLAERTGGVMLVGHLPNLNKLASLLLCGNAEANVIGFTNGGVVALRRDEGTWSVQWILIPQIIS